MTDETDQTAEPTDFPPRIYTADEQGLLSDLLDWYRAAVVRKATGVTPDDARASPVASGTSIAGLVKHLALVEDSWFTERFAGHDVEPWASAPWDDDPDWEFHSARDEPLEDSLALYQQACQRSRQAAAGHGLDDRAARSRRDFNLRFAYLHLIEETARHLGHLDVIREYLDGSTGE